jgi:NAD(P) transhydrogenase subunit alpha
MNPIQNSRPATMLEIHAHHSRQDAETRCPITPAVVKKWVGKGLKVTFDAGIGQGSSISNDELTAAGATPAEGDCIAGADIVVTVGPPEAETVRKMKPGAALVGLLEPLQQPELVTAAKDAGVTLASMEFIPRISRAQSMDALSSQANLAGYKAVLIGADHCPKLLPMLITAAGTLAPARVLVVGVGVAGLQAIATAKRLGAIVEAYDVRPETKEQVQSLGARFVELPGAAGADASGKGGYAKEQTDEQRQQQADLMAKHVTGADLVITTAAVFGKAPPLLIPADVIRRMKAGSVLVDMAANPKHGRGNAESTKPGEVTQVETETGGQVTLIGTTNLPGLMPVHASQVLANNIYALIETCLKTPAPEVEASDQDQPTDPSSLELHFDLEDEIHKGMLITHDGQITNDLVQAAIANPT